MEFEFVYHRENRDVVDLGVIKTTHENYDKTIYVSLKCTCILKTTFIRITRCIGELFSNITLCTTFYRHIYDILSKNNYKKVYNEEFWKYDFCRTCYVSIWNLMLRPDPFIFHLETMLVCAQVSTAVFIYLLDNKW